MEKLINTIDGLASAEGYSETYLEEVSLFRAEKKYDHIPLVYDQSICISIQGKKFARMSEKTLVYDPAHFLVVPAIIPFDCETDSSLATPFLGINIAMDYLVIREIMDELGDKFTTAAETMTPQPGIYLESVQVIADPCTDCWNALKPLEIPPYWDDRFSGKSITGPFSGKTDISLGQRSGQKALTTECPKPYE